MLATAIIDWRRGVSGVGRLRLTKEKSPDRFWMAVVLYMNMAFLTFWLSGKAYQAELEVLKQQEPGINIEYVPSEGTTA